MNFSQSRFICDKEACTCKWAPLGFPNWYERLLCLNDMITKNPHFFNEITHWCINLQLFPASNTDSQNGWMASHLMNPSHSDCMSNRSVEDAKVLTETLQTSTPTHNFTSNLFQICSTMYNQPLGAWTWTPHPTKLTAYAPQNLSFL